MTLPSLALDLEILTPDQIVTGLKASYALEAELAAIAEGEWAAFPPEFVLATGMWPQADAFPDQPIFVQWPQWGVLMAQFQRGGVIFAFKPNRSQWGIGVGIPEGEV